MKTFAEQIAWQKSAETRSWKRKLQFGEVVIIAAMVALSCVGFAIVDGPKRFEGAFYLFAGCLLASLAVIGPFLLQNVTVSRYVRSFIVLGLLSGAGCLAGFGFVILTTMKH